MDTTKPPVDEQAKTADEIAAHEDDEMPDDFDDLDAFEWSNHEGKPQTGEELYQALVASGFIGGRRTVPALLRGSRQIAPDAVSRSGATRSNR